MSASLEMLCYTSLVVLRFLYSSALLVVLGPEELSARGIFKKNVSPLSRTWFVGVPISWVGGLCFLCVSALLVVSFGW